MTQDNTSALQEQFLARPRTFWHRNQASRFEELRQTAHSAMWRNLVWDWDELCVSNLALQAAQHLEFVPSDVFAHPQALADTPELGEYYRILACLSANRFAQFILVEEKNRPFALSRFLNVVITARLEGMVIGSTQSLLYTKFAGT